ncbi:ABC-F type ribosomal protection protein [Dellaglioa algida]|nr:ABC-F type ribosomal protection protein [Dellaglioa algida]
MGQWSTSQRNEVITIGTIQIEQLSFQYDGQLAPIFNRVDLQLDASWKLGLIGRNGRGKTTLFRILQNQLQYQGKIRTDLEFQYFPQTIEKPEESVWLVIRRVTGLEDYDQWQILIELDKLGLPESILAEPFNQLSPGQQTKILLASLFVGEGKFQLIDEPTNHLDEAGRQVISDYLRQKSGFILISHDRYFLNAIIDHVISIDRAKISQFKGNYRTWDEENTARNNWELNEKEKLQRDIKRLESASQKKTGWANQTEAKVSSAVDRGFISHKSAKSMKRALSIKKRANKAVEEKQSLLKNIDVAEPLTLNFERISSEKSLLEVIDFSAFRKQVAVNHSVSFKVKSTERLVIQGENGSGKSSVISAILNHLDYQGQRQLAAPLKVSWLPQDFDGLSGSLQDFAAEKAVSYSLLLDMLRKLGFERDEFTKDISQMSMGQKRKVALSRSLVEPANLYIWDEPLNYLDVITRQQIQDVIMTFKPPMLIIDHDKEFVESVGTKFVEIKRHI